jgi:hypothetical protein
MGHHLHHPQPPEAVHPRKRSLSRLTCNNAHRNAYLDGLLGKSIVCEA